MVLFMHWFGCMYVEDGDDDDDIVIELIKRERGA